ncbi:retroviral-like aspartic protease [Candidatus Daviesbacteria bacterium]|nr:retroviral-like aspartic protease [Candidatus Daviesbacteria bacterium]
MKFKYREVNLAAPFSTKRRLLRPIIPVSLRYKRQAIYYEALIDSGADFCIFPTEIAQKLDMDFKKAKKVYFSGATGEPIQGVVGKLFLQVGEIAFKTRIVFADLSSKVALLGQYGFFNLCKVKFDLESAEIEIEHKN